MTVELYLCFVNRSQGPQVLRASLGENAICQRKQDENQPLHNRPSFPMILLRLETSDVKDRAKFQSFFIIQIYKL